MAEIQGKFFRCSVPGPALRAGARDHKTHPVSVALYTDGAYSIGYLTSADAEQLGKILTSLATLYSDEEPTNAQT